MKEALFHLNPLDGVGLQAQVREMLVSAILSRRLMPGEAVPSTRGMAAQLGVSRNTVTLAYQALVADGYLEGRDRSGYFVGMQAPAGTAGHAEHLEDDSVVDWGARIGSGYADGLRVEKPLNWREYKFPFVYGQADPSLFIHSDWRDCARQALGLRNFEAMAGDKGSADDPLLVDYIRARSLPRRGVMARPEQILVTLGAQNALFLIAQLLCTRGAKVVIEDPTYPDLRETLLRLGADVTTLAVDDHGMPVDERLAEADVVFVTPSHHAPTTATMPLARRRALLEAAEKYDFIIVEDDYDFEMGFLQRPAPALKSLDPSGRVIYVGSFSKSLFPGLRLGYLVAPDPVIREARGLRSLVLRHLPGHTQRTAAYFLALGHHDALIRRLRAAFAERRVAMQAALERVGLNTARAPQFGGASFWIAAPEYVDTSILGTRLREFGVLIEPGAPFFAPESLSGERPPKNYMRLAYSSIPSEKISDGVDIVASTIASMKR